MADDDLMWDLVTEVQVSAGRKKQLDQYEPINEQVTFTLEFPDGQTAEEKQELVEEAADEAWDEADRGVMQRVEAQLQKDE